MKYKYKSKNKNSKRLSKWRLTPEGLIRSREINRETNKRMRETPEGLEKSNQIDKETKKDLMKQINRKRYPLPANERISKQNDVCNIDQTIHDKKRQIEEIKMKKKEYENEIRTLKLSLRSEKKLKFNKIQKSLLHQLEDSKKEQQNKPNSIFNLLSKHLDTIGIKEKSLHRGAMHGVSCRRFLERLDIILKKLQTICDAKLDETTEIPAEGDNRLEKTLIIQKIEEYRKLFLTMDMVFATLRILAPTEEEINEAREGARVLELIWRELGLKITPKAHILFKHTIYQFEIYGGLGGQS